MDSATTQLQQQEAQGRMGNAKVLLLPGRKANWEMEVEGVLGSKLQQFGVDKWGQREMPWFKQYKLSSFLVNLHRFS